MKTEVFDEKMKAESLELSKYLEVAFVACY